MILSGILLTPTGEPYKNSSVRITANNTSPDVLMFVQKAFKTDEDGEYEIDVPNGWYHVSVFSLEYRSYVNIGNIEITDDTTQTTLNELLMLDQTAHSDGLAAQVAADAASALVSKNAAAVSATQAATSATNSANSATASQTSATNSASSASSASTSAATATTKAAEAVVSAQDAADSAAEAAGLAASVTVLRNDLANPSDPLKGAGLSGYRNSNVYIKLSDWISVNDFTGTDAAAIASAAAHCYTNKKQLNVDRDVTIPSLVQPIELMCSFYQQPGVTINIANAGITNGLFKFTTAQVGTVITGVGGLTEGSTKLTGLPATPPGSWLLIQSSEELIKDTSAGFYVKQEVATIADVLGGLVSPLNTTYAAPTITMFTPEAYLTVEGLSIQGDGVTVTNTSHNLIEVYRRSVKLDATYVAGVPNNGSQVKFNQAVGCDVNNPDISGGTGGNGYGILAFMTEGLSITNPKIKNCRHAYSARHDKNTTIKGGYMSEIIDSHWGQNLIVTGCNVIGQVQYAGRDLTFTYNHITPKDYGVRIRNTSPELKGRVTIKDNTINLDSTVMAGTHFAYITSGLSSGTFDFGRNLAQPDQVIIKDNILNIISMPTNITYVRMLTATGFAYSLGTRFEIEGNVRTDTTKTIDILAGFVKADNVDFTVNPVVHVRKETNCRISITSQNTAADVGKGFSLDLHELGGLILFANPNTLVDSIMRNISCAGWALPTSGVGAQANVDNGKLNQSGMTFNGAVPVEHSRIMTGEIFFRTLPNSAASYFKPSKEFGHISVLTQNSLQWSGMAGYDVQASGAFNNTIFNGSSFATTTGVLTGTTGTAGNLTVSAAIDGKVYVENRAGAALTIQIKELNMS